jgi:hypothetical protein
MMPPCEIDFNKIAAKNLKTLEGARDGVKIPYFALYKIVTLGLPDDPELVEIIRRSGNQLNAGQLSVTRKRPGSTQEGTLTVEKFRDHPGARKNFIYGIRLFTKMDVVFV